MPSDVTLLIMIDHEKNRLNFPSKIDKFSCTKISTHAFTHPHTDIWYPNIYRKCNILLITASFNWMTRNMEPFVIQAVLASWSTLITEETLSWPTVSRKQFFGWSQRYDQHEPFTSAKCVVKYNRLGLVTQVDHFPSRVANFGTPAHLKGIVYLKILWFWGEIHPWFFTYVHGAWQYRPCAIKLCGLWFSTRNTTNLHTPWLKTYLFIMHHYKLVGVYMLLSLAIASRRSFHGRSSPGFSRQNYTFYFKHKKRP